MRGNITRRGKTSWRLKFDVGVDDAGKRIIEYETVRGTRKDAQEALAIRLAEMADGRIVRRSSETLADYARMWASAIAPARTSGKTLERYIDIIEGNIIPYLGAVAMKDLDGPAIDRFYTHLRKEGRRDGAGGLSQQTVHIPPTAFSDFCLCCEGEEAKAVADHRCADHAQGAEG